MMAPPAETASVELAALDSVKVIFAIGVPSSIYRKMISGVVMVGAVVSTTVTVKVSRTEVESGPVTVRVTVVTPSGKESPEAWEALTGTL